jgi:23S rRNA (pseudouridine1915-N3)-methyltransferase
MKFSEIDADSWSELQPYLDTCLIPLSGLKGGESPWEATEKVALAGLWLAPLELAFRGRTVTMPAFHYNIGNDEYVEQLNHLISQWKKIGFRYVILISGQQLEATVQLDADLIIQPRTADDLPDSRLIEKSVSNLWRNSAESMGI